MVLPWIMIVIIILIVLLGVIAIISMSRKKGKPQKTNYYSLFMMGAIWVPIGIFMMMFFKDSFIGNFFFILGWIYFIIGIIHKDEWDKKRGPYLIENSKLRWAVIIGLLILMFVGIVVVYLKRTGI